MTGKIRPEIAAQINRLREEHGLPPLEVSKVELADPFSYKPPVSRSVAIAALFILGTSYGQLMYLFQIAKGTVYDAVVRHVPAPLRELRPRGRGKSRISHELASAYVEAISRAGAHTSAVQLAAMVKHMVDPDTLQDDKLEKEPPPYEKADHASVLNETESRALALLSGAGRRADDNKPETGAGVDATDSEAGAG